MIETTISEVEGVRFYKNIRILGPDDTVGGMGVHIIPDRVMVRDPELMRAIRVLGLKRVGRDMCRAGGSELYAQFPMPYFAIKVVQFALKIYWATIRWLYDNARVFKQIPESECFSWKYFTLYVWYRGITKK